MTTGPRHSPRSSHIRSRNSDRRLGDTAIPAGLHLTLAICALYYVYRYPLKINSTQTSPTYSDTPLSLQLGKYALLAAVAAITAALSLPRIASRLRTLTPTELALAAFALFAAGRSFVAILHSGDTYVLQRTAPIVSVVPIAILGGLWIATRPAAASLRLRAAAAGGLLVLAHSIANVIELALWLGFDRLPALGYTGLIGRFGGLWDDPNSCGAYSAAVALLLLSGVLEMRRRWQLWIGAAALFNLVVAWSYSSWILLLVGGAALALLKTRRRWSTAGILAAGAAVLAALIAFALPPAGEWPVIGSTFELKNKSAEQRLYLDTYFSKPETSAELLLGSGTEPSAPVENAVGALLSATGLVGLTLFATWLLLAARSILRGGGASWFVPLVAGGLVASVFVPHLTVFPLGSLFILTVGLTASSLEQRPHWKRRQISGAVVALAVLAVVAVGFNTERPGIAKGVLGAETDVEVSYWATWGGEQNLDPPEVERTDNPAYVKSGNYALLVQMQNSQFLPRSKYIWLIDQQATNVKPGQRYLLRAHISGPGTRQAPIKLGLRWLGAIWTGGIRPIGNGVVKTNAENLWRMEGEYVVPPGVSTIQVAIWKENVPPLSTVELAADDVQLSRLDEDG